jgi:hypothetical protein
MSDLAHRGPPTHLLHITVPLDLGYPVPEFDATSDALRLVMALTRSAYRGYICDDTVVEVEAVDSEMVTEVMRAAPYDWARDRLATDDDVQDQPDKDDRA